MKFNFRYVAIALIFGVMGVLAVISHPIDAKAINAATPVAVGSTTPVLVVPQGNKRELRLCNTSAAAADYCLQGSGTVSSTNWNILVPAAATTAGATIPNCWQAPTVRTTDLGNIQASVVASDPINCVGTGSTTMQYYYR